MAKVLEKKQKEIDPYSDEVLSQLTEEEFIAREEAKGNKVEFTEDSFSVIPGGLNQQEELDPYSDEVLSQLTEEEFIAREEAKGNKVEFTEESFNVTFFERQERLSPFDPRAVQKVEDTFNSIMDFNERLTSGNINDEDIQTINANRVAGVSISPDGKNILREDISGNITTTPIQQPGFFERTGEALGQRQENIQDILARQEDTSVPENVLQTAGQVAGGIADVGGEAIVSGLKGLSAITPDIIEKPIVDVASDLGEDIIKSDAGKLGLRALNKGIEAYTDFKSTFPRAARNLEAVFNIGVLLAPVKKKPKIKGTTIGKLGKTVKEVSEKMTPKKAMSFTAEDVRKLASVKYAEAATSGGVLTSKAVDKFIDTIQKIQPQTIAGKIVAGKEDPITKVIKRITTLQGKKLSLPEFQEIDEFLGEAIDDFIELGRPTKRGLKLINIQNTLRKTIENASAKDIVNPKGFDALKEGRSLWSRAAKLRDLERIVIRAELSDQPATAIRSGFRTILSNPSRLRGYSKLEQAAIKKAATTGIVGEILRIPGSRLLPIVSTAAAGPIAGAAGLGASFASRGAATKLQFSRVKKLFELVAQGGKIPDKSSFSKTVARKINSLGGASLKNLARTLDFVDDTIVKSNNANLVRKLRLDRLAILEVIDTMGDEEN